MAQQRWLLVLGDREALFWVISNGRMAFSARRRSLAMQLGVGDGLLLYSTRGAWRNPTRDRGRIFGSCVVATPVEPLASPVEIGGLKYSSGCELGDMRAVTYPNGLILADMVDRLDDAFPNRAAWSVYLRRPLLPLSGRDDHRLRAGLGRLPPIDETVLDSYRRAARMD